MTAVAGRCEAAGVSEMKEIRYLDEFGPTYFLLSAITNVSPETYRSIAPSAVQEMRKAVTVTVKATPPPPAPSKPEELFPVLERECSELAAKLERAIPLTRNRSAYMRAVVLSLRDRLNRMERTI